MEHDDESAPPTPADGDRDEGAGEVAVKIGDEDDDEDEEHEIATIEVAFVVEFVVATDAPAADTQGGEIPAQIGLTVRADDDAGL